MHLSLISIIIPNYNRETLIGETLDSILKQDYPEWECIIVDDGSTDNSIKVIQKYVEKDNRFKLFDRPIDLPKGANACRNYGFELSKGEYINWFDSDDVLLEDFLSEKMDVFLKNKDLQLVISPMLVTDLDLEIIEDIEYLNPSYLFKDFILWKFKIITGCVLFKRSFLEGQKLFRYGIHRGQETEFFSRLFFNLKSSKYKIVNKQLFLYRQHDTTKTSKNETYIKKYKESQSYIIIENFKRSLQLKDKELVKEMYKKCLMYYHLGLKNNHRRNSKYILSNLIKILSKSDQRLLVKLLFYDISIKPLNNYLIAKSKLILKTLLSYNKIMI